MDNSFNIYKELRVNKSLLNIYKMIFIKLDPSNYEKDTIITKIEKPFKPPLLGQIDSSIF